MKIGILSDTHGYFDPEIHHYFKRVTHILHGGDIGKQAIIDELSSIAPVTACSGNVDVGVLTSYRAVEQIELAGVNFFITHIVNHPGTKHAYLTDIDRMIYKIKPQVVIFGHTHNPEQYHHAGIFFFNPGSAGRKRFDKPRSAGIMEVHDGKVLAADLFFLKE